MNIYISLPDGRPAMGSLKATREERWDERYSQVAEHHSGAGRVVAQVALSNARRAGAGTLSSTAGGTPTSRDELSVPNCEPFPPGCEK
jgi:hypothetical protein